MGARSELEAGPNHRGVSSPPISTTKTPIGTKSSDEEHSNAENAETVDIGKANSVPNVGGDVVASKISKKRRSVQRSKDWCHIRARNRRIRTERDLEKLQESERR